jgi:hypothetical protein
LVLQAGGLAERIVTSQQQLAGKVRALEALAHVQQLQGLIAIQAWCR